VIPITNIINIEHYGLWSMFVIQSHNGIIWVSWFN
jgi:hypothetical protein